MKQFLYETHAHTSQSSTCGKASAEEVVEHYKALGYSGVVITDHMNTHNFRYLTEPTPKEKADRLLAGYREAKKHETEQFDVLLGMEIRFLDSNSDFLLYGFEEDFVYRHELDSFQSLKSFRKIAEENGILIFQAHPFRFGMKLQKVELLDGIEVYNGNANHNSNNDIADLWASKYGLRKLSGSDYHGETGMPTGGVLFNKRISDSASLAAELKSRDYHLKDTEF